MGWKRKALAGLAVLALGFSFPLQAQIWGVCKMCGEDAYGQLICVRQEFNGPEGGESCYAGRSCQGDQCYNWCYTTNPCSWT